ncbi:SH2 domain containing protein [Acanthamoeba castellanii str. Neff]|uniref:SH2 domain containing protein n=1 Tax=Acanthamoeba castellanii (strain ATCC 30010 / Neff) TaxID=1257118 RepID=L8GX83_ACACF|nr:SH2 domain containing protein [Acanthamoeba castellanii str. Neff]ELR17884.1 SH2 domain containing protein [Acanthamoeba castellanii str. Neff]
MMQTEVRTAEETEGGKPILGTILTTAPEIMDGSGSYNEKTDVYSFGLVMWEVATRQRLFASYLEKGSVSQFVHAICKEHKRPRIPEDILPDLRVLIEKCWHSNRADDVLKLRCLRTLLVQKGYTKLRSSVAYTQDIVTIERFGEILDWFGPIVYRRRGSPSCFILDEMKSLLEKQWFFGDVSAQEAQSLLGKERGCFLVRFTSNPKYPGCFTVSRISASGQPSHIRIIKKDNRVSVADDKDFESLTQLVEQLGPVLRLEKPCPKPSKYWVIFKSGQEEEDDASDTSSLDSLSDDSEEEEARATEPIVEHGRTKTPHVHQQP